MINWPDFDIGDHRVSCFACARRPNDRTMGVTRRPDGSGVARCFRCDAVETLRPTTRNSLAPHHVVALTPDSKRATLDDRGVAMFAKCLTIQGVAAEYLRSRGCCIPPEDGEIGEIKMAGKVGMKGGGGARRGAGRKPKAKTATADVMPEPHDRGGKLKRPKSAAPVQIEACDMLTLLQNVALGRVQATATQVRAAIAAVQYTHLKRHDGGKKDELTEKAKKASMVGRFAASAPPLRVVGREVIDHA